VAKLGVELEDGMVMPRDVSAERLARGLWRLELTIAEGRTREVRRLCEALGLAVDRLVRTRFGPVKLGNLESGQTRPLTAKERDIIGALGKGGARESKNSTQSKNSTRGPRRERTGRDSR
jgi:23S rRNA pseudouridine2605 synthase